MRDEGEREGEGAGEWEGGGAARPLCSVVAAASHPSQSAPATRLDTTIVVTLCHLTRPAHPHLSHLTVALSAPPTAESATNGSRRCLRLLSALTFHGSLAVEWCDLV